VIQMQCKKRICSYKLNDNIFFNVELSELANK